MTDEAGKKMKVKNIFDLKVGQEMFFHDFQVSASDALGNIKIVDMELVDAAESDLVEYKLQPGAWRITPKNGMQKLVLADETYIETDASKMLTRHFTTFFRKLDVYAKYKLVPSRKILLGSEQGMGKSACIRAFCRTVKDQEGMCILRIDSDDVSWEVMTQMFMKAKVDDVKTIVLIVEDIGGTALDERRHHVSSDLLNFLSGNSDIFKVPTLVIGTTNFLNELGPLLNDRPGRFDVVKQLDHLSDADTTTIVQELIARDITADEKKALLGKKFTPAYCLEAILRAELHETPIQEAVDELIEQRKKSQGRKHGDTGTQLGFSSSSDFD